MAFLACGNICKSILHTYESECAVTIHLCVLNITNWNTLPWLGLMDYEHNLHHLLTDHIVVALYTCFSTHGCCRWIHSFPNVLSPPFVDYSVSNSVLKRIGNVEFFNSRSNNLRWIIFVLKFRGGLRLLGGDI